MKGIVIELKDISDSREIMESKESPKIRWFIYILLTAIVTAIIFACIFRIDEYSRVNGEIKTQEASSSVLSANNCKLKEILVSEGQSVKAGDVLFILDSDYAESQKQILQDQLNTYTSELNNTELLKKSIEENKNLFNNDVNDSKYYYRFEQYNNSILLTAQEIDNTNLTDNLSKEETENNISATIDNINDKKSQISEYNSLLSCIKNNKEYSGKNETVKASYDEYEKSYKKADLLCEQYWSNYSNLIDNYNEQVSEEKVTAIQVENAKQESERAYSALNELISAYSSDIRSQILLIENQLITDSENVEMQNALNEYTNLKNAVEQGSALNSENSSINAVYEQFLSQYNALFEDYNNKTQEYQQLYNTYSLQNSSTKITETDLNNAQNAYDSAVIDRETLKSSFISQIQTKITSLNDEIKTLENKQKSLEVSLKNVKDLETYEKLSADKLKNEAIITVNSEIDNIKNNISSLQSQLIEINETIKNSEIKAAVDGTVTLISEFSVGDIIQAGSSLCSIIPNGENLKVTLYIPESEIAKVKVGQKTEYIIDAMPYDEYGKITGEILSISADSIANESTGTKYYIAQASLSDTALTNQEGNVREIKTGMLLEAKAISGSKKVIVWLLEKINFLN